MNLFSGFDDQGIEARTNPTYVRHFFLPSKCVTDMLIKMFSGDILPHELSRFHELGSFLQSVVPSNSTCICELITIDSAVWHYLARASGGKLLFPSLRELHWAIREPSSTEILFVLTSSLRRLSVCHASGWSQDLGVHWKIGQSMLFRTIFTTVPFLTHLTLRDTHPALLRACLSNVDVLLGLRAVSLYEYSSVDFGTLRKLSSMESLEELSFGVDLDWLNRPVDFSGFSSLKTLKITFMSGSAPSANTFLDAFSSPNLRQLALRIHSEDLALDEIHATCTQLAQRFPSLEELTIPLLFDHGVPLDTALAPLFPLRMAKVSLSLFTPPDPVSALTHDLFGALAGAWPQLTVLYVAQVCHMDPDLPSVTPQTLLMLARGCPRLEALRLQHVASPRLEDVREYPVLRHGLRTLVVDRPEIREEGQHVAWALVLDRLFLDLDLDPDMESLRDWGALSSVWGRVLGGVQLCRLGRTNLLS